MALSRSESKQSVAHPNGQKDGSDNASMEYQGHVTADGSGIESQLDSSGKTTEGSSKSNSEAPVSVASHEQTGTTGSGTHDSISSTTTASKPDGDSSDTSNVPGQALQRSQSISPPPPLQPLGQLDNNLQNFLEFTEWTEGGVLRRREGT